MALHQGTISIGLSRVLPTGSAIPRILFSGACFRMGCKTYGKLFSIFSPLSCSLSMDQESCIGRTSLILYFGHDVNSRPTVCFTHGPLADTAAKSWMTCAEKVDENHIYCQTGCVVVKANADKLQTGHRLDRNNAQGAPQSSHLGPRSSKRDPHGLTRKIYIGNWMLVCVFELGYGYAVLFDFGNKHQDIDHDQVPAVWRIRLSSYYEEQQLWGPGTVEYSTIRAVDCGGPSDQYTSDSDHDMLDSL